MITCNICGSPNADDAMFCSTCGNKIEAMMAGPKCPNCGGDVKPGAVFCSMCGFNMAVNSAPVQSSDDYEKTELLTDAVEAAPVAPVMAELVTEMLVEPEAVVAPQVEPELTAEPKIEVASSSPFAKVIRAKSDDAGFQIAEPEEAPVVEPVVEATEMITEAPIPPIANMGQPSQSKIQMPFVPIPQAPSYEATELLTDAPATPVAPVATPAYEATEMLTDSSSSLYQPDAMYQYDPLAQFAASQAGADIIPPESIPSYNPADMDMNMGNNGEDYSYAKSTPDFSNVPTQDEDVIEKKGKKAKKAKKEKGKGFKVFIIVQIILVLLIGAGIFAYFQGYLDEPIDAVQTFISDTFGKGDKKSDKKDEEKEEKLSLDDLEMPAIPDQIYKGEPVLPEFTLKIGDKTLKEGKDYAIACKNNEGVGTATITITGVGDVEGSISGKFNIIYGDPILDDAANKEMVMYVKNLYTSLYGREASTMELINDCHRIKEQGANFDANAYILGFINNIEHTNMVNNLQIEGSVNEYLVTNCLYAGIYYIQGDPAGIKTWSDWADENGFKATVELFLTDPNVSAKIQSNFGIGA